VSDLELVDHVTFTGYRFDVPAIMAGIDVFAMPSYEEPFGMVYLEAMAVRKPVVGSRSGGVVEFIQEGVTGLLSDPDDEVGLADNLAILLADPDLRARMGSAGREAVLDGFTSSRMSEDMEAVYRNMLERTTV
jgi:glycosyltransferase involved in cell wall biosynthesis